MLPVYWTDIAEDCYAALVEYQAQFSIRAAESLEVKINDLVERLSIHNSLCPPSELLPRFRRCVVTEDISLIYEVLIDRIEIIAFVDNRMRPVF